MLNQFTEKNLRRPKEQGSMKNAGGAGSISAG
jgi:hypothetical protein